MTAGASGHTNKVEVVHVSSQVVLTGMTQQVVDSTETNQIHRGQKPEKTIIYIMQLKTQNKEKNKNKKKQQENKQEEKGYTEITRYTKENKNKQGKTREQEQTKTTKKREEHNKKSNKDQNKQKHMK